MADRPQQGVSKDVNRCPRCGLPQHPSPETMPALGLAKSQLDELHQIARAFDTLAAQVPADKPYNASDFVHWLLLEHRARSVSGQRPDQQEHRQRGQSRRHQGLALAS